MDHLVLLCRPGSLSAHLGLLCPLGSLLWTTWSYYVELEVIHCSPGSLLMCRDEEVCE